ncbi:MAG: tetratricopeptide repeat protein [Deltaproteobacteria bacterium]|nr:tetratricopeptide repeat protein [Deltaproteobacteria bacterium]
MRHLWVVAAVVAVASATAVQATEKSERLHARGLLEFHAGHYPEALGLFDQALVADPQDPFTLYYRAVTKARLGDQAGEVQDLRAALKIKPDFNEAALELGLALVEQGKFDEATKWLQQARNTPELEAQASLFLGVAYLRLNDFDKARSFLTYAMKRDEQFTPTARYYSGIADLQQSRLDSAEAHFKYVIHARPDSQIAKESKVFLDRVAQARSDVYSVHGAIGMQYDSNVILAPSSELGADFARTDVRVAHQGDGRVTLNVGGSYLLGRSDWGRLTVGYEFYQSLHFQLSAFDLQDHQANVDFDAELGPLRYGVHGKYDYYLLQTDDFLREGTLSPRVALPEGDAGWTEIEFRLRRRDFLKSSITDPQTAPGFHLRDATYFSPSLTQLFFLGSRDRYLSLRYRFEKEETTYGSFSVTDDTGKTTTLTSREFNYDANQLGAGITWTFPYKITGEFDYAYRHFIYDPVPSQNRKDVEHLIILVAHRPITEHLSVDAGYFGQLNNTNRVDDVSKGTKLFEYERHIVSVSLEVRY